jgi:hypothetical protein
MTFVFRQWLQTQAQGLEAKFRKANRACKVGGKTSVSDLGSVWHLPDAPLDIFPPREFFYQGKRDLC